MIHADMLRSVISEEVYPASVTAQNDVTYFLVRDGIEKYLCILTEKGHPVPEGFAGDIREVTLDGADHTLLVAGTTHENAAALRRVLSFTRPVVQGIKKAAGLGDRLGIATPGHVRAMAGSSMVPFLAQQSIREMSRTGRTPREVIDTATWGVFQEGFKDGFGSDADHLKTVEDAVACLVAGFTMFTVDPGDHVDDGADGYDASALEEKLDALPWDELEISASDCRSGYVGSEITLASGEALTFSDEDFSRAAVKYGCAVAHTAGMWRALEEKSVGRPFEMEMSVDETATATSAHAHYFVANELKRLGVKLVSLAPRFVGRFEKGVDYIGDLGAFEASFKQHVAIANTLGPYKLSLHSGSDKFTVYPIAAACAGDLVHLKTAGTSYLEAVRAIGGVDPAFFREILDLAIDRYEEDKKTYHVSAELSKVTRPEDLKEGEEQSVLDSFDARQVLHVTYGSALDSYRARIMRVLRTNEEAHYDVLQKHLSRHVTPFA
ncbi:tagaturonate epimerase family protein [Planctomycetota bacterium]